MRLQLELFVDDLERSIAFYTKVLGLQAGEQAEGGYTPLTSGSAAISLNKRSSLPSSHPTQAGVGERLGRGVEVVLYVDDLQAAYRRVIASGWPLAGELSLQPWGEQDFRVVDPDGYYLRISHSLEQRS